MGILGCECGSVVGRDSSREEVRLEFTPRLRLAAPPGWYNTRDSLNPTKERCHQWKRPCYGNSEKNHTCLFPDTNYARHAVQSAIFHIPISHAFSTKSSAVRVHACKVTDAALNDSCPLRYCTTKAPTNAQNGVWCPLNSGHVVIV
ncbi:hypothetical protein Y032_0035g3049 [Ancylostoma ceylanicum]|nr:hypothetical protein Y032_0035g3049 [Ancylostoma ceylanicum]